MAAHQGDAIHVEGLGSFDWMVVDAGTVNCFPCNFFQAVLNNEESFLNLHLFDFILSINVLACCVILHVLHDIKGSVQW